MLNIKQNLGLFDIQLSIRIQMLELACYLTLIEPKVKSDWSFGSESDLKQTQRRCWIMIDSLVQASYK